MPIVAPKTADKPAKPSAKPEMINYGSEHDWQNKLLTLPVGTEVEIYSGETGEEPVSWTKTDTEIWTSENGNYYDQFEMALDAAMDGETWKVLGDVDTPKPPESVTPSNWASYDYQGWEPESVVESVVWTAPTGATINVGGAIFTKDPADKWGGVQWSDESGLIYSTYAMSLKLGHGNQWKYAHAPMTAEQKFAAPGVSVPKHVQKDWMKSLPKGTNGAI